MQIGAVLHMEATQNAIATANSYCHVHESAVDLP